LPESPPRDYSPVMAIPRSREAQEQFDRVAPGFFSSPLSYFETHGAGLVSAAGVKSGDRVLDLACGAGSASIPAASIVGRSGKLVGIDISRGMLDVAARRARTEGFHWAEFHQRPVEELDLEERFDVALCGFAVHHFDDQTTVPRVMARHLEPGGRWAFSLWAEGSSEPHRTVFNRLIRELRPDLAAAPGRSGPQGRAAIERLAHESGLSTRAIELAEVDHVLDNFDDYWHYVKTSGGRSLLTRVSEDEAQRIRDGLQAAIAPHLDSQGRLTLCMDALYVTGSR